MKKKQERKRVSEFREEKRAGATKKLKITKTRT
jgi:hypothetical protein